MEIDEINKESFDNIFGGKLTNNENLMMMNIKERIDLREAINIAKCRGIKKDVISFRPFISRVGGKTKISSMIVELIPKHKIYVEPFIGGGSVFFKQKSDIEVVNDLDKDIFDLWIDMKSIGNRVQEMNFICSRKIFFELKNSNPTDTFNRLFRNLYLSLLSFKGDRRSFVGEKKCIRRKNIGSNLKKNGEKYKERLKDVKIFNKDFRKIIDKFDSVDTFFYFDPPYVTLKGNWGYNPTTPEEIWNSLKNIKGKFILSYENIPQIKKLFLSDKYTIKTIKTIHQASGVNQDVTELLIIK